MLDFFVHHAIASYVSVGNKSRLSIDFVTNILSCTGLEGRESNVLIPSIYGDDINFSIDKYEK